MGVKRATLAPIIQGEENCEIILFPLSLLCLAIVSTSDATEERLPVPQGAPVNKSKAAIDKAGNLVVDYIGYVPVSVTRMVRTGDVVKKVIEVRKEPVLIKPA